MYGSIMGAFGCHLSSAGSESILRSYNKKALTAYNRGSPSLPRAGKWYVCFHAWLSARYKFVSMLVGRAASRRAFLQF